MKLFLLLPVIGLALPGSVYFAHRHTAPISPLRQITHTPIGVVQTGDAAFGDWSTDAPGVRRHITVADLPTPRATPSVDNGAHMISKPDMAWPQAPVGFKVERFAENLAIPRKIITAPNGDLFLAECGANRVTLLRAPDGASKAATTSVFADGLTQPFGVAFYPAGPNPQYVYVANTGSVVRYAYHNGDLKATGPAETVIAELPGGGRLRGGGHWTRDLAFTPDSATLFVSVGSHSNHDDPDTHPEEFHRADILEYSPAGEFRRVYASGIRNPVGIAIQPGTHQLWTSVNERDTLGDHLPPDYITHVEPGGFYGWPYYYIGSHPDPDLGGTHPEMSGHVIVPDVLLQSHMASLCLTFYGGTAFPAPYRGMIFAAEHGSWNRAHRTGYKVIMVPLKNGKAVGEYQDFLTGFVAKSGDVWGRPVGVTVAHDGSLIVTDDGSGSVWRVSYTSR